MPLDLKKTGKLLGKGLVFEFGPNILKGAVAELFSLKNIDQKKATLYVKENKNLWESLSPENQGVLKRLASRMGGIDWLDADWVIDAVRDSNPRVASLFLGWQKAHNWLERQVVIIKSQVQQSGA